MREVAELNIDGQAVKALPDAELPYALELELTVKDRDTIAELWRYSEGEPRDEFALVALRIGVLSLRQPRGQIDADMVRSEAERMLSELSTHLGDHVRGVEGQVGMMLKHYFDPNTGRFNERIENLVKRDGELERVLRTGWRPRFGIVQDFGSTYRQQQSSDENAQSD